MANLKSSAPSRGVQDVGEGDYVKIGGQWKRISHNTAAGSERLPRDWTVTTADGRSYGMFDIQRYAKSGDLDE